MLVKLKRSRNRVGRSNMVMQNYITIILKTFYLSSFSLYGGRFDYDRHPFAGLVHVRGGYGLPPACVVHMSTTQKLQYAKVVKQRR